MILISLIVAALTQVAIIAFPTGPWALGRIVVGAVSCGVLAGYEPTVGTGVLLVFIGLSAGASFGLGPGAVVTALAVVTTAFSVLASGQGTGNISIGAVAVVGFLAAAGRRQYALRAEEAELRLADAERAREEHARAAALAERANGPGRSTTSWPTAWAPWCSSSTPWMPCSRPRPRTTGDAVALLARARALAVEGLSEARQAVGTLRTDAPPLIDGLRQLVDTTAHGSSLEITGTPRAISAEGAVALRRTAQEGLTNAAKHAPGAAPTVQLAFLPAEVVLTVTDGGGAPDGAAAGHWPTPVAATASRGCGNGRSCWVGH